MHLITHSLLSAWQYLFDCYEGQEENAMESFLRTLNRVPTETTEAMQNGIDFENEVYAVLAGNPRQPREGWQDCVNGIARHIMGAQTQIRTSRVLDIGEDEVLLYGILDALRGGVIYDIKFSGKYEVGKYIDSTQHPAYFELVPEATEFQYLIFDGEDVFIETYRRADTRPIQGIIKEFYQSIEHMGYMPIYRDKWIAK